MLCRRRMSHPLATAKALIYHITIRKYRKGNCTHQAFLSVFQLSCFNYVFTAKNQLINLSYSSKVVVYDSSICFSSFSMDEGDISHVVLSTVFGDKYSSSQWCQAQYSAQTLFSLRAAICYGGCSHPSWMSCTHHRSPSGDGVALTLLQQRSVTSRGNCLLVRVQQLLSFIKHKYYWKKKVYIYYFIFPFLKPEFLFSIIFDYSFLLVIKML